MTTAAEHVRAAILAVLAQSETPLTTAELFDRIDSAESKQSVAAQINYLKKSGQIFSGMKGDGTSTHMLAERVEWEEVTDQNQDHDSTPKLTDDQPSPSMIDLPDVDLHRIVWSQSNGNATRFLTLTITDDQPRLNTSGAFAVDPAMLRQMADLIDVLQQKAA